MNSRQIRLIITLLCIIPFGVPKTAISQEDSTFSFALEQFLNQEKAEVNFSGVILVARGDHILFLKSYGFADRNRKFPNQTDTKFRIASMTKMFTGIAISQLAQAHKLRFTDTVHNLIPYLTVSWSKRVTVHQLLTHTAGLGSIWTEEFNNDPGKYRLVNDYLPLVVKQTLQFSPGTSWAYSNAGYVVLGAIIERLTSKDYRSYIRDSIFVKAEMSTEPNDEVDRDVQNRAVPYTRGGLFRTSLVSAERMGLRTMMPAGGAVLSAEDLWRFALALLNHKLLNKAYTDTCSSGKVHYRQTASYGYGFANEYFRGDTIIFHDGGADGISANFDIFPPVGIIAIVLSNYDHPAVAPYRDKIRELVELSYR